MQEKNESVPKLNAQKKIIYDLIINANARNCPKLIIVYGHGGTGKTFMWKTIISTLRPEGKFVMAVASLGITSLLLPLGRTTHYSFNLPLELTKESLCKITKNSHLGNLLADTDMIIWDEAPMNDRRYFEVLDRSLTDILNAPSSLIGGKSVSFKVFTLRENIRISRPDISADESSLVNSFALWLLDVGDGIFIDFIYDQSTLQTPSAITLQQKAIVCPKNETADIINSKVLDMVNGERTTYVSQDEAVPVENDRVET
ncbi:DNA helicase [Tanacetum coccineum]